LVLQNSQDCATWPCYSPGFNGFASAIGEFGGHVEKETAAQLISAVVVKPGLWTLDWTVDWTVLGAVFTEIRKIP